MAIRKRGRGYQVDVRAGRHGRIRRTARTHAEAREIEAALKVKVRRVRLGLPISYTLSHALSRFLTDYAPQQSRTVLSVARCLRPFLEGYRLDDAPEVAANIRRHYERRGRGDAPVAPGTINRRLALLRRLCNLAYREWGWIDQPIGQKVRLMSGENARHVYLQPADVERLALACRSLGAASCVLLAAYTGLRRGELLRLDRHSYRDGWLVLDAQTKSGKPRAVPVPEAVRDIAEHLPAEITADNLRKRFDMARVETGLTHVRFHDLRHTFASWLVQRNVSLRTVGELMGHSSPIVTQRYAHLGGEHLKDAMKVLDPVTISGPHQGGLKRGKARKSRPGR